MASWNDKLHSENVDYVYDGDLKDAANASNKAIADKSIFDNANAAFVASLRKTMMDSVNAATQATTEWNKLNRREFADANYIDIYLKAEGDDREIRFPWLPEKIQFKTGETVAASFDIYKKGPVHLPLGLGLRELEWDGIFPGLKRHGTGMNRLDAVMAPRYYHDILVEWKQKQLPLNVLVTSTPFNFDCYIADYSGDVTGGFGDFEYQLHLIERTHITIKVTTESGQDQSSESGDDSKRPSEEATSYTIKAGDSMWEIAQRYLGDGIRWQEIYKLNKTALDKKAAEMGHASNNGTWVFPGTVIKLPSKKK
ncbi:MAG: LysM peptidoglycan-binding domain-containing protein [Peptococcaceae bacterium]|nr:LysM peptidoglycan-binding domain-containing protein [Peptococcaceae bacterium]